jgi:hypothetical protein
LGEFHDKLSLIKDNFILRDAQFPVAPNKIKVAIGMRRVGKSYFIYQEIFKLLKQVDKKRILYINFEDDRLLPLTLEKLANLVDAFYSRYPDNHENKCYLFFDEIQNVKNWPLVIRRLHDSKNAEIYLTGSSAKLLSKEIATNLRGRSLAIEIWPYSFDEFMTAKNIFIERNLYGNKTKDQLNQIFNSYLIDGGFPEVTHYNFDVRQQTLQEYLEIVIYRDIIERYNIKTPAIIKYMALSMIHNVAKPFSINKFYNDIKSQGYAIGKDILYEYANHIEDAYLTFSIPIFDKSIRKVNTNPKKIYAIDSGLIRSLTLDYENDFGRLFENLIYLDLRRRKCNIFYYLTKERYEVDFLIQTPSGEKKLFQVVWSHEDKSTLDREQRALESAIKETKIKGHLITLQSYLREGLPF